MSDLRSKTLQYVHDHREQTLEELIELVSIPSISTDPQAREDLYRAAEWVAGRLRGIGMERVQIFPLDEHPLVYGEWLHAGEGKPTVLIYGHYDVQPVEPLELWKTPPFEATQVGENLYGRGASDMKGQVITTLSAVRALQANQALAVNVKFLIEGEEEIGSPALSGFIETHQELLGCDFMLNPDGGIIGAEIPSITYALRGLGYFELRVYGPGHDLHSGVYGGSVNNPAQVLCELVAGMHDSQGRVTLPGFYDRVEPLDPAERAELARLPMDDAYFLELTGAPRLYGEAGYTTIERIGARPTLEINGLYSGFIGEGSKTVLPAYAMAKISTRLVPDQDPQEVFQQLERYIAAKAPDTVRYELINWVGECAAVADRRLPWVTDLSDALEAVWGKRPVFRREGGSVPVAAQVKRILGVDSVMTGFGLPDDNLHAPNEKQHLPTLYRGIDALVHFFCNLGEI